MSEIDLKGIIKLDKQLIDRDKEIERLCNALNEVIERNSKAIEYINTLDYENEETYDIAECVRNELLDILQGSDK